MKGVTSVFFFYKTSPHQMLCGCVENKMVFYAHQRDKFSNKLLKLVIREEEKPVLDCITDSQNINKRFDRNKQENIILHISPT